MVESNMELRTTRPGLQLRRKEHHDVELHLAHPHSRLRQPLLPLRELREVILTPLLELEMWFVLNVKEEVT